MPRDLEIAVIDDDQSFRIALVESLSSLGFEADGYACAEDYIEAIGRKSFHCIVTDIHMPGMSGLELLKKIKQKFENPPPVVMMITAYGDDENYKQAMDLGADDFLTKPIDFNLLKEKLKSLTQ